MIDAQMKFNGGLKMIGEAFRMMFSDIKVTAPDSVTPRPAGIWGCKEHFARGEALVLIDRLHRDRDDYDARRELIRYVVEQSCGYWLSDDEIGNHRFASGGHMVTECRAEFSGPYASLSVIRFDAIGSQTIRIRSISHMD